MEEESEGEEERKKREAREALLRSSAFSALLGAASAALPQETRDGRLPVAAAAASSNAMTGMGADFGETTLSKRKKLRLSSNPNRSETLKDKTENSKSTHNRDYPSGQEKENPLGSRDDIETSSDRGDVPDSISFRKKRGKKGRSDKKEKKKKKAITIYQASKTKHSQL